LCYEYNGLKWDLTPIHNNGCKIVYKCKLEIGIIMNDRYDIIFAIIWIKIKVIVVSREMYIIQ